MDTEHGFSYMTMNTRLASTAQKTGIQLQRYEQNKDIETGTCKDGRSTKANEL